MPEPKQSAIRKRFTEALAHLQAEGMLEQLEAVMDADNVEATERQRIGDDYFRVGLPCPFLEEGSCSIYADRPLICREYLVTSPAVHCQSPTPETIDMLPLAAKSARALIAMGAERSSNSSQRRWLPLPLALRFAEQFDREDREDPAPDLFADFLERAQPQ
jgi:Fe-S-cluster containining protein